MTAKGMTEGVHPDLKTILDAVAALVPFPQSQLPTARPTTPEIAGVGIAEVDSAGRVVYANPCLAQLIGYGPGELAGRSIFVDTHPDDVAVDRAQFRLQTAGSLPRYELEKRLRRRNGDFVWCNVISTAVCDATGRFLYAVRVQHDITRRKRAEGMLAVRGSMQEALHELSQRLQQATTLDAVYDAGLDAIVRALGCPRASILLLDQAGVMRFQSWRHLSEGYRRAVEGHSPWKRDEPNPAPIWFADVNRAQLPSTLRDQVLAEGIQALAFIPVLEHGRLLGKFMAYYGAPHAFSDEEIDVGLTIARQLGSSIERVRAQVAAQQLAAIVESSDDAIISKDLRGIITTWNRAAERLFGYTAEEAIGQPITLLIPPDRLAEEPHILERVRTGRGVEHFETVRRRKDGSYVDISITVSPVRDVTGAIVGASKIARDITERKLAQEKVRRSEAWFRELLEAIPAAIYTTDAEGRITYFNQAAVDLAGHAPAIGVDRWCVAWKLFHPDGTPLPHEECPMAVALKEGRVIRNAEAIAERPDGVRVPFIPYPTPLRDENGKIVGAINMLIDISERKRAETQQRMLVREMHHRVKNNMQMLQSLLHTAARRSSSEEATAVLREATGKIAAMATAQRALYSGQDTLDFDAEELLRSVCDTAEQSLPARIRFMATSQVRRMPNDLAMPLALVLSELLTNACKHGARQGGEVRVRFERQDTGYLLTVEDDGEGFDLDTVQEQAFGLRLVQALAHQVRGRFYVMRGPSRCCLALGDTPESGEPSIAA